MGMYYQVLNAKEVISGEVSSGAAATSVLMVVSP